MIRAALRINQLSEDATGWYAGYLAALDSGDVDAYAQFLSPDCVVTINNNLPYDGIGEIKAQQFV